MRSSAGLTLLFVSLACTPNARDSQRADSSPAAPDSSPTDSDSSPDSPDTQESDAPQDLDGDGWAAEEDCDDQDPAINPGAQESCNGLDDDCDGVLSDDEQDQDGDGYVPCELWEGTDKQVLGGSDCDDGDALVHPAAKEICNDQADNNCDGQADGCLLSGDYDNSEADASFAGTETNSYVGRMIVSAGDMNGDGCDEVLITAPMADGNESEDRGDVYLVYGPLQGELGPSKKTTKLRGSNAEDMAGIGIAGELDTNADGIPDILVGASGYDNEERDEGIAYLVLGPITGQYNLNNADAKLTGSGHGANAGRSVASATDLNQDGYDDLFIGSWFQSELYGGDGAGQAYVVLGPVTGRQSLSEAPYVFDGEVTDDYAGRYVNSAGDVDGDGQPDLLVGAYGSDRGADHAGVTYLLLQPPAGQLSLADADAILVGEDVDDRSGRSVAACDTDGDGHDDILIGAPWQGAGGELAGAAYLVRGPVTGTRDLSKADAKAIGEEPIDYLGHTVATAGDVDGDGLEDIVFSACGHDAGGKTAGAAYLLYSPMEGQVDMSDADAKFIGENAGDDAGHFVHGVGDLDGDGYADIGVGAWAWEDETGKAYFFYGGGF